MFPNFYVPSGYWPEGYLSVHVDYELPAITWMLNQFGWYWRANGTDLESRTQYHPPIRIPIRYEEENKEIVTTNRQVVMSKHTIYVDRRITSGYIAPDHPAPNANPLKHNGASEILGYEVTPDIDATEAAYMVFV